jgi:hypothetical protein
MAVGANHGIASLSRYELREIMPAMEIQNFVRHDSEKQWKTRGILD